MVDVAGVIILEYAFSRFLQALQAVVGRVHQSRQALELLERFDDARGRKARREVKRLVSSGAGFDLKDRLLERPELLGQTETLWVLADEGAVRTDQEGRIDTDGNHAPDGIVGPYREKEGSFYAIKEIWSPVFIEEDILAPGFPAGRGGV